MDNKLQVHLPFNPNNSIFLYPVWRTCMENLIRLTKLRRYTKRVSNQSWLAARHLLSDMDFASIFITHPNLLTVRGKSGIRNTVPTCICWVLWMERNVRCSERKVCQYKYLQISIAYVVLVQLTGCKRWKQYVWFHQFTTGIDFLIDCVYSDWYVQTTFSALCCFSQNPYLPI